MVRKELDAEFERRHEVAVKGAKVTSPSRVSSKVRT
jgi:hypothetical protein